MFTRGQEDRSRLTFYFGGEGATHEDGKAAWEFGRACDQEPDLIAGYPSLKPGPDGYSVVVKGATSRSRVRAKQLYHEIVALTSRS